MIIINSTRILLVGALLALTQGANIEECKSKCSQQFKSALDACNKGCDNYVAAEKYDQIVGEDENDTLSLCKHSCEDTFPTWSKSGSSDDADNLPACYQGCDINKPSLPRPGRPRSLLDVFFGGDNLFQGLEGNDDHRNGGLTISFGMPRMPVMDNDFGFMNQHIGHMMKKMNEQMNQMMHSVKSSVVQSSSSSMENGAVTHSGGKMYVMQSGPGFHEEKTYDIGPNGKMTLIKNDMMDRENPLEMDANENDVEVFEPLVRDEIDQQFAKIIRRQEDAESSEEQRLIEPILQELDRKIAEQKSKHDLDGPRLPETGLRSRDACIGSPEKMEWSEWVGCMHLKLGMPRWVMTTSICMGIIFLLWLCLVIPSKAPKQRVVVNTLNPKEVEANAAVVVVSDIKKGYPVVAADLPPSYDDVANLSVKLEPVDQQKSNPDEKPVASA